MSPSTVSISRPSRSATMRSWANWAGELSNTVTRAPGSREDRPLLATAGGQAQHRGAPLSSGNQFLGTGRRGVRTIDQSPA